MRKLINFQMFLEEMAPPKNPNTPDGYRDSLAKQATQKSVANRKPQPPQVKPLPTETDDIETIKKDVENKKADLTQTKSDIEKMQIDGFEVDNQKEIATKIDQYKKKTDQVSKLVKNFDQTIKTIKTNNQPAKKDFRSNVAGARTKKYF